MYLVCSHMGYKVCLTADGIEEIFAGVCKEQSSSCQNLPLKQMLGLRLSSYQKVWKEFKRTFSKEKISTTNQRKKSLLYLHLKYLKYMKLYPNLAIEQCREEGDSELLFSVCLNCVENEMCYRLVLTHCHAGGNYVQAHQCVQAASRLGATICQC